MSRWNHPNQGFKKGHPFYNGVEKGWFKKGHTPSNKGTAKFRILVCQFCEKTFHRRIWRPIVKKPFCSTECRNKQVISHTGKEHWNWQNKSKNQKERNLIKYKKWRSRILKRDDYTCRNCGQKEKQLIAHHIKEWAKYPKLRYKTYNGLTLCKQCHTKWHIDILSYFNLCPGTLELKKILKHGYNFT